MASTATLEEFVVFSGEYDLTADEKTRIQMLLDQAARQITSFLGSADWSDVITTDAAGGSIAKDRQLHIVKRYWDNPNGVVSESFDGVSVSMDDRSYEGLRLTAYDKSVLSQNKKKTSKIQTQWISRNNGSVW